MTHRTSSRMLPSASGFICYGSHISHSQAAAQAQKISGPLTQNR